MSRIVSILAGCVVMVAAAAFGVSAASATFTLTSSKCAGTGVATLCWAVAAEGKELFELSGSELVTVKGGTSAFTVPSIGFELLSTSVVGVGMEAIQKEPLVVAYKLKGRLEFLGVTVNSPKGCKLQSGETLTTEVLIGAPNRASTEVTFEPETGSTGAFAAFTVEDNGSKECPSTIIGSNRIKGAQTCGMSSSAVDLANHRLECKTTGSKLKFFGGNEARFEGTEENELSGKDPWSGQEA